MPIPKPSLYDTAVYGSFAVAGAGAYLGIKHGSKDLDSGDRMKAGVAYTGMAAAAGLGLYKYGPKKLAKNAWSGARGYVSKLASMPKATAATQLPVTMGAGAVLGAMIAGEDHRTKGAVIGGGGGAAASVAWHMSKGWRGTSAAGKVGNFGVLGKFGVFAGASALAFGAGAHSYLDSHTQAAVIPGEAGEQEYVDMGQAQQYDQSGPGRRSRNLRASGDVVLGAHRGRHG